jgi:predicted membrane chloride channel (bestrophin family)
VIFLSYIFVGIDEIGVEVENPFPLLPMFTLSSILKEKVADQFAMFQDMPKIKYK